MIFKVHAYVLALGNVAMLLAGCGAGGTTPETINALHESTACISCHEGNGWKTPDTGNSVVAEWKLSTHMTASSAGCSDCHDDGYMHPSSCGKCHSVGALAKNPTSNPDRDGKCAKCHDSTKGFNPNRAYNGISRNTLTEHFSTPTLAAYTSGKYNARYVTKGYEKKCRSCHNPHDSSSQMEKLRQWARSGKGNVTALSWTNYDFGRDPTRSTITPGATPANSFGADCVRCHTATGYISYLTNKSIAPAYGATSKTGGKEVLACNACHTNYSYARRVAGPVTAYYNKSTVNKIRIRITETYPDIGESNLCLSCHVGRETGKIIKQLADPTKSYDFAKAGFENSHYLTAGATIFKTSGFEFYSSQYYVNPSFYAHDKVGVENFNNTGTSGPCITCHMKPGNHTFLPVVNDSNDKLTAHVTALTSTTCNNALCHNGSFSASGIEIQEQKELFHAALEALKAVLQDKLSVYFATTNPYFFTTSSFNVPARNWVTGGVNSTGPNNMGAAFNYNLLHHDYGAFAHNRFYAKRLIYDSISWLYDNDLRTTTSTPLGYFSDVEAAIQNSTILSAQQKSDACNYLFTSRTYTHYSPKDSRNVRPGSSSSNPVY